MWYTNADLELSCQSRTKLNLLNFVCGSSFSQNFGNGTDNGVPNNVFFCFIMLFGLRRAAPFVCCPVHFCYPVERVVLKSDGTTLCVQCCLIFPLIF